MLDYITQHRYMMLFSSQLDSFKQKSQNLWNCRCPYCGDSKKRKSIARGYFFVKDGTILYKCHNCGTAGSLSMLIKHFDPSLHRAMMLDSFGKVNKAPEKVLLPVESDKMSRFKSRIEKNPDGLVRVSDNESLYSNYLIGRDIPKTHLNRFIEIPSMKKFADSIEKYAGRQFPDVKCIGIPFIVDEIMTFIQCRNIEDDSLRYMTFEINPGLKIFGFDDVDFSKRVSVLEGPFDSIFVDNAVANAGATDHSNIKAISDTGASLRFIFDRDYETNPQVMAQLVSRIKQGHDVVIFDRSFRAKDINESISNGSFDIDSLNQYLDSRTFSGLRANLELSRISK